jgi:hypothetical protein
MADKSRADELSGKAWGAPQWIELKDAKRIIRELEAENESLHAKLVDGELSRIKSLLWSDLEDLTEDGRKRLARVVGEIMALPQVAQLLHDNERLRADAVYYDAVRRERDAALASVVERDRRIDELAEGLGLLELERDQLRVTADTLLKRVDDTLVRAYDRQRAELDATKAHVKEVEELCSRYSAETHALRELNWGLEQSDAGKLSLEVDRLRQLVDVLEVERDEARRELCSEASGAELDIAAEPLSKEGIVARDDLRLEADERWGPGEGKRLFP